MNSRKFIAIDRSRSTERNAYLVSNLHEKIRSVVYKENEKSNTEEIRFTDRERERESNSIGYFENPTRVSDFCSFSQFNTCLVSSPLTLCSAGPRYATRRDNHDYRWFTWSLRYLRVIFALSLCSHLRFVLHLINCNSFQIFLSKYLIAETQISNDSTIHCEQAYFTDKLCNIQGKAKGFWHWSSFIGFLK